MSVSKVINPNFAIIRTFDLIYIGSLVLSSIAFLIVGFHWVYLMIGLPGGGLFLARWILVYSGNKVKPQAEQIVYGGKAIASWTLGKEELRKFADDESKRQSFEAQTAFIGFLFAGLLVSFLKLIPVSWWQGLLLGAGLGLFGLLVSSLHKKIYAKKIINSPGDIFIGYTGVVLAGIYNEWDSMGRDLTKVEFDAAARSLVFTISVTSKNGTTTRKIYAPVPESEEHTIEKILRAFATQYSENGNKA